MMLIFFSSLLLPIQKKIAGYCMIHVGVGMSLSIFIEFLVNINFLLTIDFQVIDLKSIFYYET